MAREHTHEHTRGRAALERAARERAAHLSLEAPADATGPLTDCEEFAALRSSWEPLCCFVERSNARALEVRVRESAYSSPKFKYHGPAT